jgi:CheY-like chemotaxis protein
MAAKKILVADDSLTIQKVIRLALSNEGYEIQAVSDGNDALDQISTWRPDVVLIDVSLPNRSAFELKRAVNEHGDLGHVKFVLMSSAFESVDEGQVSEVGFAGRLTKPFDPAHLRQILSQALGQGSAPVEEEEEEQDLAPLSPPPPPSKLPSSLPPPPKNRPAPPMASAPPPPPPSIELSGHDDDDISQPIRLDAYEPMTPPPVEAIPPPMSDFTATHLLPPRPESGVGETDIRKLTESTIKMSGLDDFEWSIQEPSLKPMANLLDKDESSPVFPPGFEYTPPPLPGDDESEELHMPPQAPEPKAERPAPTFIEREEPTLRTVRPSTATPAAPASLDEGQMNELIRQHVEKALEKFAREVLPDVAERVIKQEIHRMLSEQP